MIIKYCQPALITAGQIRKLHVLVACSNITMTTKSKKHARESSVSPPAPKRIGEKHISTTTSAVVSSFFTPLSKKAPEKITWKIIDSSLIVGQYVAPSNSLASKSPTASSKHRIAAFDFDSTLVKTISKLKFAKDANDWCWWHGTVPGKLKELYANGYILLIVSNQNGISLKTTKDTPDSKKGKRYSEFRGRVSAMLHNLDLPFGIYAATEKDQYRKPMTGMWEQFTKDYSLDATKIDFENSVFVGDAAGRKSDFSCSDRNLASNIGIPFKTPEEFFLNELPKPFTRGFDPSLYLTTPEDDLPPFQPAKNQEIIVLVGSPGAGKSTFCEKYLIPLNYERINQDKLKTKDRCLSVATERLKDGKSVVIDNTNPTSDVRNIWISLAKKAGVPIRCFYFTASKDIAKHNNLVRALSGRVEMNPENREVLPEIAFTSFASRLQEPKIDEGFKEIVKIFFVFNGSAEAKKIWTRYWF